MGCLEGASIKMKAAWNVLVGGYGVCLDGSVVEADSFWMGCREVGKIGVCPIERVPIGEVYVDKVGYSEAAKLRGLMVKSGLAVMVRDSR